MQEKKVSVGSKIVDDYGNIIAYVGDFTDNGFCYKDESAFESGKGICYIGEYDLKEMEENKEIADADYYGWTRENILNLVDYDDDNTNRYNELTTKLAEIVFSEIDWQEPTTYFNELLSDEEELFDTLFEFTEEEINYYLN